MDHLRVMDEFLALAIHDVHLARMQIDSAVVFSGGCIIFHFAYSVIGVLRHRLSLFVRGECSLHSPPIDPMLSKNQKGFSGSINPLQRTRRERRGGNRLMAAVGEIGAVGAQVSLFNKRR